VWELDLNSFSKRTENVVRTFPWSWGQLHENQPNPPPSTSPTEHAAMKVAHEREASSPNRLTPAEKLNLGRCHGSHRIGGDTVLLVFGSGRPSCNSALGYRLDRDVFFRTNVLGPLPIPRFTFASVYVKELAHLIVHGGFANHKETSQALGDTLVLDLAPGMRRDFRIFHSDPTPLVYPAVTSEDALSAQAPRALLDHLMEALLAEEEGARPARAARMLGYLQATQRLGGRPAMFLHLVAIGQVQLTSDGNLRQVQGNDDLENGDIPEDVEMDDSWRRGVP
jgi:hypothetical protein